MDGNVLISFVVPAYNAERTIEVCLQSIQEQEYRNIEIIVVDDGSKDSTLKIVRKLAKKDGRIKAISQTNGGVSSARNKGLENVNGKYVIFVDSDDYISKDFLRYVMEQEEKDFICFSTVHGVANKLYEGNSIKKICKQIIYPKNWELNEYFFTSPWSKCYLVQIIKEHNLQFDTAVNIGEDALFNLYYLDYVSSVQCIQKRVYNYCDNPESATRKYNKKILQADLNYQNKLKEYIQQHAEEDFRTEHVLSAMNGLWQCLIKYFGHVDNGNTLRRNYTELSEFISNDIYFENYEEERKIVKKTFGLVRFSILEICYRKRGIFLLNLVLKAHAFIRKGR